MKKLITLMLCIAALLSLSIPASAAGCTPEHTEEAEVLYDLGLFKGTGHNADGTPIFALEQKANRIQGLVMLIRLLGKEADALAYTGDCPFTDVPAWAEKYAAYAYDNGITKGISSTTFGSDDSLVGKAYVTFVLRALGYDDGAGDFSYSDALTFGAEIGLIGAGGYTGDLYRDACAEISYTALKTNMKGAETTLLDKLVADGVVSQEAAQNAGFATKTVTVPLDATKQSFTFGDVQAVIPDAASVAVSGLSGSFKKAGITPNFTEERLFANNSTIWGYCTGEFAKLPDFGSKPSATAQYSRYDSDYTICTVLDEEYTLIAYCVIPKEFNGTALTFTLCNYGGLEVIKGIKSKVDTLDDLPVLSASAVYVDRVLAYEANGDYVRSEFLRIDASKASVATSDIAYYAFNHRDNSLAWSWYNNQYTYLREYQSQTCIRGFEEHDSGLTSKGSDKRGFLIFYDSNMNAIAYSKITSEQLKVNETTVDNTGLKENAVELESSVFYIEVGSDGKAHICLDKSKLPESASNATYYCAIKLFFDSDDVFAQVRDIYQQEILRKGDLVEYGALGMTDETGNLEWLTTASEGGLAKYFFLFDSEKNIVGYAVFKDALTVK